jgi:ketosteroid isomerase-like protein
LGQYIKPVARDLNDPGRRTAPKEDQLMAQVTEFLQRWTEAERTSDVAVLDHTLTDDFVGVGPLGFMLPKPAWLARHQPGELHYETFELDEVEVRTFGKVALVTARQTGMGDYHGAPIPEAVRATLVLVDDGGEWRLAGIHMSFIAGTLGAPPLPGARDQPSSPGGGEG